MKKDMTFSADFARCGYTKVSRQAMQIAFTPGDKCEKEAKVLLCILGFAYFKKGEVSFHFKDYACERGEWITSYSELARRTGLIRRSGSHGCRTSCRGRMADGHGGGQDDEVYLDLL